MPFSLPRSDSANSIEPPSFASSVEAGEVVAGEATSVKDQKEPKEREPAPGFLLRTSSSFDALFRTKSV